MRDGLFEHGRSGALWIPESHAEVRGKQDSCVCASALFFADALPKKHMGETNFFRTPKVGGKNWVNQKNHDEQSSR